MCGDCAGLFGDRCRGDGGGWFGDVVVEVHLILLLVFLGWGYVRWMVWGVVGGLHIRELCSFSGFCCFLQLAISDG